ncbi:MAG TPA: Hsp70 family protein [Streptosporangiaceae bacterium]|nr:Hsp70 family protein [Streptosporangiaceae bacterium]
MTTYGIDLGTTQSCIAYIDKSGRPVVLKSAEGQDTTPSVVYFDSPENVVVGQQAKDMVLLAPHLVSELIKRQMGSDARYSFYGQDHTPESISALILRELAHAAGQAGEEVHDVVITVPAYFGLLERDATRKAGKIAGLNVLDVLPEPVAAALNYQALGEEGGQRNIFVFDLGGGTFDTTVIRIDGDDVRVVCTDGDHHLGGADWDSKVSDFLMRTFKEQYPQLDPGGDEQFLQELATSAEQLKKALSAATTRKQNLRFDGSVAQVELTRERLEELTSELLERTMEITRRTLATARGKGVEQYDDVLLVGGMTIMPAIARTLKERFGLEARMQDPHLAVAKGAAMFALLKKIQVSLPDDDPGAAEQAAMESGIDPQLAARWGKKTVATVVPRAFGLKVVDEKDPLAEIDPGRARSYIAHLLTANTELPAETGPRPFSTVADNQRAVRLEVWEQAGAIVSEELEHNTHIGQGMLEDLPPRPAGAPFLVVFQMTATGLLTVRAWEESSGREVRFTIEIGNLNETQVQEATEVVARYEVNG